MKKITGYAKLNRKNPTPAEKRLKVQLLHWGIRFRTQRMFDYYIVDFLIPERRLVIELDGSSHKGKEDYDNRRTKYLENLGLNIIRFPNHIVFSKDIGLIKETILSYPEIDISKIDFKIIYGTSKY